MATTLLSLANALVAARRIGQDTSTTSPGVSDAIATEAMNEFLTLMLTGVDRRAKQFSANSEFPAAANNSKSLGGLTQSVVEFVRILRGSTVEGGTEMEQWPLYRVLALQISSSTTGTPTKYALERVGVTSDSTGGSTVGKWRLHLHPIADGVYNFSGFAFYEPPILASGGSLDTPDITVNQQRALIRMTGWEIAIRNRKPRDFIEDIARLVDKQYRGIMARRSEDISTVSRVER